MDSEMKARPLTSSPIVTVTPARGMVDERAAVVVTHLMPRKPITLYAYLISEKQIKWESWGHYVTDDNGNVEVESQESLGGTYIGREPMGLFWSLKPAPGQMKGCRLRKLNVMKPHVVYIQVFAGHLSQKFDMTSPIAMTTAERWYIRPGVKRCPIKEGNVRGTLFLPNGTGPFPLVIDLWGGGGGIIEYKSSLLASHGFAAAVLAYTNHDDLPVNGVSIEYFEEACEYFCNRPDIDSENVGFLGTSQGVSHGFEIAAETDIRLKCAILTNGGFVRADVVTSRFARAVTGLAPPGTEFHLPCEKDADGNFLTYDMMNYERILQEEGKEAFVKVENLTCPCLFLISGDDPSHDPEGYFQEIYKRMQSVGKQHLLEVCRYPQAGHLLEPPYAPLCTLSYQSIKAANLNLPVVYLKFGGLPKPHADAQEHSWRTILDYFDRHLRCQKSSAKPVPSKL